MKSFDGTRALLPVGMMAAMLSGCGGSQGQVDGTARVIPQGAVPAGHTTHGKSWMKPGMSSGDLLYVSDAGTDDVYALSYPSGNLVGTLTGFQSPQGLCADGSGNIYVADAKAANIVEYAHGGTSPIKMLQGSGRPSACWVNPKTGDLAVTNFNSFVSIYKHASGNPANYSTQTSAIWCAYDNNGNLFVAEPGQLSTGNVVQELPSGATSLENIGLDKFLGNQWPGGIQWYGKHLIVAKSGPSGYGCCGRVYRFTINGTSGQHSGSHKATTDLADIFIYKSMLIASTGGSHIDLYDYPKIHGPTQQMEEPGSFSYGVTISVAASNK